MQSAKGVHRLVLLAVMVLLVGAVLAPTVSSAAPGQSVGTRWLYDWAYRGYYILYRTYTDRGHVYVIEVAPETRIDDPDLYVGTARPRGTNDPLCSPSNYLWRSTHPRGYSESIRFTAGYTGIVYFCVYAYRPNWAGWYVRVRRLN